MVLGEGRAVVYLGSICAGFQIVSLAILCCNYSLLFFWPFLKFLPGLAPSCRRSVNISG